jgi:hypothetical protein
MWGANVHDVDIWIRVNVVVVCVDFWFLTLGDVGRDASCDESFAFGEGGGAEGGDEVGYWGGGPGEQDVGGETGGDPASSWVAGSVVISRGEGREKT